MKRHKTINKFLKFYEKRYSKLIREGSNLKQEINNRVNILVEPQEGKPEPIEESSPEKIMWHSYIDMEELHSDFVRKSDDLFADYD